MFRPLTDRVVYTISKLYRVRIVQQKSNCQIFVLVFKTYKYLITSCYLSEFKFLNRRIYLLKLYNGPKFSQAR